MKKINWTKIAKVIGTNFVGLGGIMSALWMLYATFHVLFVGDMGINGVLEWLWVVWTVLVGGVIGVTYVKWLSDKIIRRITYKGKRVAA